MKTVLYGFLGCGSLALVAYVWTMISSGRSDTLNGIISKLQNSLKKKVNTIEEKQGKLKVQIDNKESLSKESKKKIADIIKKSSKDIQNVLKQDDLKKIQNEIDEEWSNI